MICNSVHHFSQQTYNWMLTRRNSTKLSSHASVKESWLHQHHNLPRPTQHNLETTLDSTSGQINNSATT